MQPLLEDLINLLYFNTEFELIIVSKLGNIESRGEYTREQIVNFIKDNKDKKYRVIMIDIYHNEDLAIFEKNTQISHYRQKIYIG